MSIYDLSRFLWVRSSLAELCCELRISHEDPAKRWGAAAVLWKLNWGGRIPSQGDSLTWLMPQFLSSGSFPRGCLSSHTIWWLASPWMADSRRRVQDFPGGPEVKNLPANAGDTVRSLVQENPTFHGAIEPALHSERLVSCSWRVASTLHTGESPRSAMKTQHSQK